MAATKQDVGITQDDGIYLDWVTATAWDGTRQGELLVNVVESLEGVRSASAVRGYKGYTVAVEGAGTAFLGHCLNNSKWHIMATFSSALAQFVADDLGAIDGLNVTRIDIQRTRPFPYKKASALLKRMRSQYEEAGVSVGWVESTQRMAEGNVKMSTLYLGSWNSAKMWRVYMKETMGGGALRAELVLKGKYAAAAWGKIKGSVYQGELERMGGLIESEFWTDEVPEKLIIGRRLTDTERWLLDTVLPVLDRVLQQGGGRSAEVAAAYAEILDRALLD